METTKNTTAHERINAIRLIIALVISMIAYASQAQPCNTSTNGPLTINKGCTDTLIAYGYTPGTITWNSIAPGAPGAYNAYLGCLICNMITITGDIGAPAYVDYEVCGDPIANCGTNYDCITVRVYFNQMLNVNLSPFTPTICYGETGVTLNAATTGGTPPYTYTWSTGETTSSIVAPAGGIYGITLNDNSGCAPATNAIVVTENKIEIVANAGIDKTVCSQNASFQINGSAVNAGGITWSNGAGGYNPSPSAATTLYYPTAQEILNGSIDLIATTTGNNGCPADKDTIHVTFSDYNAQVQSTSISPLCNGSNNGSANVTVATGSQPPYSYSWNTVPAQLTNNATGLVAGTYSVTINDALGCKVTYAQIVTQPIVLVSSITSSTNVSCFGGSNGTIVANASGGTQPYTYLWNNAQTTNNITGLKAGSYNVTITDKNNCKSTVSVNLTEPQPLYLTAQTVSNVTCFGGKDGAASSMASGGTSPYIYSWSNNNTSFNVSGLSVGTYSVISTDAKGCVKTAQITIPQPQQIQAFAQSPAQVCNGTNVNINAYATGGNGNYNYSWSNGSTGNNITINANNNVNLILSVTDSKGCKGITDTASVKVIKLDTADIYISPNQKICEGTTATLLSKYLGTNTQITHSWSAGLGNSLGPISIAPTSTSTYSITFYDQCGQVASKSTTITVNQVPKPLLSEQTVSGCGSAELTVKDSTYQFTDANYIWNFGDGSPNVTTNTPTHKYRVAGTYTISLTVVSKEDCKATTTANCDVIINPIPQANIEATPGTISTLYPEVKFTNHTVDADKFEWNFGDGYNSTELNPVYSFKGEDYITYTITMIASNQYNCYDTAYAEVVLEPEYTMYIPNAFTPNQSGLNDIFKPFANHMIEFKMEIFDRWGELIFTTTDIEEGWNGRHYGKNGMVQDGVYIYKIKATDKMDKKHDYMGHVTVLK